MAVVPILAVSFIMNVVAVLFVICAVVLVLIILVQKEFLNFYYFY